MTLFNSEITKLTVIAVLISLIGCTTTTSYHASAVNPPPLSIGKSYEIIFLDGKHEKSLVTSIEEYNFKDKAGHTHNFSEIDTIKEKKFSFLKTTGFIAGALIVVFAAGAYYVGKTIDRSFE